MRSTTLGTLVVLVLVTLLTLLAVLAGSAAGVGFDEAPEPGELDPTPPPPPRLLVRIGSTLVVPHGRLARFAHHSVGWRATALPWLSRATGLIISVERIVVTRRPAVPKEVAFELRSVEIGGHRELGAVAGTRLFAELQLGLHRVVAARQDVDRSQQNIGVRATVGLSREVGRRLLLVAHLSHASTRLTPDRRPLRRETTDLWLGLAYGF